jgi:prepilin-type N-terminal cleavage/methylation domain-containing protein
LKQTKLNFFNKGLTLVEVLIAVVIGTLTVAAVYYSYSIFSVNFDSMLSKTQLNRDLRFALNSISRDIRNAGYQSTLPSVNGYIQSPFPTMPNKLIVRKNTYFNMNSLPGVYASGSNDVLEMIYDIDRSTRIRVSYAQLNNGFLGKRVSRCTTANCFNDNEYRFDEEGYYNYQSLGLNMIEGFKVKLFDKNGAETPDVNRTVLVRVTLMMWGLKDVYKTNVSRTFVLEDLTRNFGDTKFRDLITALIHPRNL